MFCSSDYWTTQALKPCSSCSYVTKVKKGSLSKNQGANKKLHGSLKIFWGTGSCPELTMVQVLGDSKGRGSSWPVWNQDAITWPATCKPLNSAREAKEKLLKLMSSLLRLNRHNKCVELNFGFKFSSKRQIQFPVVKVLQRCSSFCPRPSNFPYLGMRRRCGHLVMISALILQLLTLLAA